MDGGVDSTGITTTRGMVSFPKIDCYYNGGNCTTDVDQPPEVAQNEAHSYGEANLRERSCPYQTDDDIFEAPQNCTYFTRMDGQEYAYRYMEYNPADRGRAYPYLTKRLIKTSTGQCSQYTPQHTYQEASPDGPESIRVYPFSNGTNDETLRIAVTDLAYDSTTYAFTGTNAPQNASASDVVCGPRCILLYAVRQYGPVTNRPEEIFTCPITVLDVINAQDEAHNVPDDTARLAAASIALSGRYTNPNRSDDKNWQQYRWYPFGYVSTLRSVLLLVKTCLFSYLSPIPLYLSVVIWDMPLLMSARILPQILLGTRQALHPRSRLTHGRIRHRLPCINGQLQPPR